MLTWKILQPFLLFWGALREPRKKKAAKGLNTKFTKTSSVRDSADQTTGQRQAPFFGKCRMQTFASTEEFVAFVLNRISPALNSNKVKTAVVMPMEMFEQTGRLTQTTIDAVVINTIRNAQKNNQGKNNIIVLTTVRQDNLAKCIDIPNFQDLHYWVPGVLRRASYQDDRVALAVDTLQNEGILVLADSICEDEIANLLLRKKFIEHDPLYDTLSVSKIYHLAELLAEQCRMERRHFQSFTPFRMHDYIRQLDRLLSDPQVAGEIIEKSRTLKARIPGDLRELSAVALDRVTHRNLNRCPRSQEEILTDYEQAMAPLNGMIGLEKVKNSIRLQLNTVLDYGSKQGPGHYVFAGNPGTGKTEVARLMGDVFKALGLLKKGHLVECRKRDLVAEHIGGSAIKTMKKCTEALDGVLFVDEAYELVNLDPTDRAFKTSFDEEAYNEIMTFMENNRQRICVIFAGYTKEMKTFVKANPGMERRISKVIDFPDYNAEELFQIFRLFAGKEDFALSGEFEAEIRKVIGKLAKHPGPDFGNAGAMRKLFQSCRDQAAQRFAMTRDEENKYRLLAEDIPEEYNLKPSEEGLALAMQELNGLIGLENVKSTLKRLFDTKLAYGNEDGPGHYVFAGNPGTGKTEVARLFGRILKAQGLLSKGQLVECKSADLVAGFQGQTAIKTRAVCESALDGVLFIDEAYDLVNTEPTGEKFNSPFAEAAYNEVMTFMENNRHRLCVIFAGYTKEMQAFVDANPGMRRRISKVIDFPDYNAEELFQIFRLFAGKEDFALSGEFEAEIRKVIGKLAKHPGPDFGNAGAMRKLFQSCRDQAAQRFAMTRDEENKYRLLAEDIPEEHSLRGSEEDLARAMHELNELIGLESVKNAIQDLLDEKQVYGNVQETGHFVFTGNPGTGKTEVARKLGKIFKAMGLLSKGHVVECTEADLVAQYTGHTAVKTRSVCQRALDGVLFVDEAYRLVNTEPTGDKFNSPFAEEAYTELMTFMENNRHRVCVVFAGYADLMEKFLDANDGMRSRVGNTIHFPDYTDEELLRIIKLMASREGYTFAPEFEEAALHAISVCRQECTGKFANAREARNLLAAFRKNVSARMRALCMAGHSEEVDTAKYILTAEDTLVGSQKGEREDISTAMADLNELIGLDTVKQQVRSMYNRMRYAAAPGKPIDPGHYIFAGNPGTGKTEVARLMGRIFKAMGVLSKGHVVEVSRVDLVGGWVGRTAIKTTGRCKEALGGILFVDEAYTLIGRGDKDFGPEALETIMKFMEDNRSRICVIFAGYEEPMAELMAVNPGISSRIKNVIHFQNYSPVELQQILCLMARKAGLEYTEDFLAEAGDVFAYLMKQRGNTFGNAREARKLLDAADERRSNRIVAAIEAGADPDSLQRNLLTVDDLDLSYKEQAQQSVQTVGKQPAADYCRIPAGVIRNLAPYDGMEEIHDRIQLGKVTDPSILFVRTDVGEGTAFLISPDGYALTCNHVINGAHEIHARFRMPGRPGQEDSWHTCQVVNTKSDLDIALLKLEGGNFPYLRLAAPDREIRKGEEFLLSGYPFGNRTAKDLTTFYGYVASSERQTDENGLVRYNINSEAKSGNSGAPIIALSDGCVIGMLLGSMTGSNRNLVEEINYMRPIFYFWEEFLE